MSHRQFLAVLLVCLIETKAVLAAINISCVGDSITYGAFVSYDQTYPAKLQTLLGPAYTVNNFGVSGTCALTHSDNPYWSCSAFTPSHGSPSWPVPDVVIIMLGSNDSKPQNWQYGTNFIHDYTRLIATYTNLSTHPRVLLCTPPPVYGTNVYLIDPIVVATNIAPDIRQVGASLGLQVVDMQSLLAGHPEWFPDYVHPNASGTTVMAAIVYTALQGDTMNGSVPSLGVTFDGTTNVVLSWPAGGAGWVMQSTAALGGTNLWVVEPRRAGDDGTSIRFTNSMTAGGAMFRLWRPTN